MLLLPVFAFGFTDESHYSKTFNTIRFYRVFTPPGYDHAKKLKRYPVIYYFHGCGGSYQKSGTYSYADFGLTSPEAINRTYDPAYDYPNNSDFENVAHFNDVIIVCVDGKIDGLSGCGVYFPSLEEKWSGNYYNFSLYIRELIDVIDARYNTKTGPQFRAVSGLSMGGQAAIWIAATNPHLFSSASEFCHSPSFYDVGEPSYLTTIDVGQLWRNFRGLPFRHSTNDRDYLRYYTSELYSIYSGAGFENEFYLADFCNHHAARIDLQFDFHLNHFLLPKTRVPCFSFINLYPDFEVWGYNVKSDKKGNGWIYLRNVSKNGAGIYTRERLPWGKSLPDFDIVVTTPPVYLPNKHYNLTRYSYKTDQIHTSVITADLSGRLTLHSKGGIGEEIGINGDDLQQPVFILTDTINENIFLENNILTYLSFDLVNLSDSHQTIDLVASVMGNSVQLVKGSGQVKIPAASKMRIDSMIICKGRFLTPDQNRTFLTISASIDGILQERDYLFPVIIKPESESIRTPRIKVFDGRSEELLLFKYIWNGWNDPVSTGNISEGTGNGNGRAEEGEIFSIWVQLPSAFDPMDTETWHPTIPINNRENPDVKVKSIRHHRFSTGREVLSAEISLARKPTKDNPVTLQLQAELLKTQPLENSCHRPVADNFTYSYYNILIYEDGTAGFQAY
jgi:hypothetical protein